LALAINFLDFFVCLFVFKGFSIIWGKKIFFCQSIEIAVATQRGKAWISSADSQWRKLQGRNFRDTSTVTGVT
jgi:hypothetical protein